MEAFQIRLGVTEMPVAPLAGDESVGAAGGGGGTVVKLKAEDQALVPPEFAAFTRQ